MSEFFYDSSKYSLIENRVNYLNLILDNSVLASASNNFSSIIPTVFATFYIIEYINTFRDSKEFLMTSKLYNSIVRDYLKLNSSLELNSPIEISSGFSYAYKNGYLSKEHHYKYITKNINENMSLLGATIMTGGGCCRHSSSFLNEVFKKLHIKSYRVYTGMNTKRYKTHYVLKDNIRDHKALKELLFLLRSDLDSETLEQIINEKYSGLVKRITTSSWKYPKHNIPTNHVINVVVYKGKVYYVDSTNDTFYNYSQYDDLLISDEDFQNIIKFDDNNNYIKKKLSSILKLSQTSQEDNMKLFNKTRIICEDNKDLFENFYREHKDVYEEVNDKIKILKK